MLERSACGRNYTSLCPLWAEAAGSVAKAFSKSVFVREFSRIFANRFENSRGLADRKALGFVI